MTIKYTESHEWMKPNEEDEIAAIGITEHAAAALGTLVFIELPTVGRTVKAGEACAVVESAKSASDVYSPLSGEIVEINEELVENPEKVNDGVDGEVWMFKVKMDNVSELDSQMNKADYDKTLDH